MPYYNDRHRTRGDEVATAIIEAYANGVEFETLIKNNSVVRLYWHQVQHDIAAKEKQNKRLAEQRRKLVEKKKIEAAKRAEVVAKLSPEEIAAFGLNKKGYHR